MKFPLFTVSTALLLGLNFPAGAAVDAPVKPETPAVPEMKGSPGQELLRVTNDMWFLLSGVVDRKGADAAAERFDSLITEAERIGNMLQDEESMAQDLEALDMLHYRIAEALDDLSMEFESLCRAKCYGSAPLIKTFHRAVEAGLVGDELVEDLSVPKPPLSESESRQELVRYRRLVEPDKALLAALQTVQDVETANRMIENLKQLAVRLNSLQPQKAHVDRSFSSSTARSVREAYAPVEQLLWGIRSEIVRIAGLPGYDETAFDNFSDALDVVYESLGNTHRAWFRDVFDESFRTDLDEALHENATTSN